MPAPIEAFHEENRSHRQKITKDFLGILGGGTLVIAGTFGESAPVMLGGSAIMLISGLKGALDAYRHEDRLHNLNMQPTIKGGV